MERLLQEFIIKSQEIIKDNLTGIYLHGSAVMGCFNPEKSDLDLILSKKEGGEWALDNVPTEYHTLIKSALSEYAENSKENYDFELAKSYAEYMLNEIK